MNQRDNFSPRNPSKSQGSQDFNRHQQKNLRHFEPTGPHFGKGPKNFSRSDDRILEDVDASEMEIALKKASLR